MRRRALLGAFAGIALARPILPRSQPAARRVTYLSMLTPDDAAPGHKLLIDALLARGWTQGRNLMLEWHYAESDSKSLSQLAARIVRAAPDVIVANGPAPALELKKAGTKRPVVFVVVFDPVKLGLAESLARPGGSFTGLSTAVPEGFFGKQLTLLREAVPKLSRLAMLSNPRNPIHTMTRDRRLESARTLGFEPIELQAATLEEIEPAFREAARRAADAMYVGGDPLTMSHRPLVAELALRGRLPTFFLFREHVEAGGLMSYGADRSDLVRRGAEYVDRILRGALPRDLPIEQPTKFDLVINLKTARALGLALPQSLLLQATEVIE
ncbi:MAG: ABC transporter substrate-binding protein [Pseudomonadota bacterium]